LERLLLNYLTCVYTIRFVCSLDLDDGEIAVDFNEALGGGTEKGDIVLIVPLDAIEPISE
jgi:hypothetical protein